jgi:hypothetical protein
MCDIEQAIFTSAKTDSAAGYHVVAQSVGVLKEDARELSVWCPSHDALLEAGTEAVSFNFHPLPSGAYCLSRTLPAGWEYSGRGGMRVYTHCLIVPPEVLARFANNPFALLQAALAAGVMEIRRPLPKNLEPLTLVGRATPVDQTLLIRLSNNPGPHAMAVLVQAARSAVCLAVAGDPTPSELFAGVINCLPPSCRTFLSFSTGLKFSLRRPFHLIALPGDPGEQRWMAHQHNVTALDMTGSKPLPSLVLDGWTQFIERALASGRTSFLAAQLAKRRFDLNLEDLPALGLQLLEDLEESTFHELEESAAPSEKNNQPGFSTADSGDKPLTGEAFSGCNDSGAKQQEIQQAHSAHRRFEKTQIRPQNAGAHLAIEAPSHRLDPDSPEVQEKLELLDDLVYDALSGREGALGQLQSAWPEVRAELGDKLLGESREQYLRYALTIWESCLENDTIRNPTQAIQALDVLCVLFEE